MTHFEQDQRFSENESHRDEEPRRRERGQHRDERFFERSSAFEGERQFGRGADGSTEREYRGGMAHHPSRPYLQRQNESERSGDGGRHFGSSGYRSAGGGQRSGGGGGFGSAGYGDSSFGGGSFGSGGYAGGGSHSSGYSGGYSGSGYADDYSGSSGSHGGSSYGGERTGRSTEREQGQRSWQGSGSGSREGSDGPHAGKGPKGFRRSDERLNEATCDCLERNGQLDASNIEVTCKDGIVTLRGTVDSRRAKRLAEEAAEGVYGVKDVMNELKVDTEGGSQSAGQSERSTTSKLHADSGATSSSTGSSPTGSSSTGSSSTGANPKR